MIMDWKNRRRLLGINVLLFAVLYLLVAFNKDYLRPAFGHIQFMGVLTGSLPNFLAAFLISLGAVNGGPFEKTGAWSSAGVSWRLRGSPRIGS